MPTYLPTRASGETRVGHLLASIAIALALVFLIEMTIKTPPQASEITSDDANRTMATRG